MHGGSTAALLINQRTSLETKDAFLPGLYMPVHYKGK